MTVHVWREYKNALPKKYFWFREYFYGHGKLVETGKVKARTKEEAQRKADNTVKWIKHWAKTDESVRKDYHTDKQGKGVFARVRLDKKDRTVWKQVK